MNDERLNRYLTQENLRLRSENSQLQHQMEAKDNILQSKDSEILRHSRRRTTREAKATPVVARSQTPKHTCDDGNDYKRLRSESYNWQLHASPLAQSALKNIKISYSPKMWHFANCLFFRQQMLSDPDFGHLPFTVHRFAGWFKEVHVCQPICLCLSPKQSR